MPQDLYALPPEEFTAARDAAVKQARVDGDRALAKELAALRRPTVAAALVNRLVREQPDLVGQLVELGARLGTAQSGGDGAALRALGEQRRALVAAVTGRAVEGHPVTAAVRAEVEATLDAAMVDPAAAEAVQSGRLVRPLSYAGLGSTDLGEAVAPQPRSGTGTGTVRPDTAAAERAAQQAAGRLDDAVRALERAQEAEDAAVDAVTAAVDAETEAEQALADARAARAAAEQASAAQAESTAQAAEAVRRAQEEAERTRAALDRLRRS